MNILRVKTLSLAFIASAVCVVATSFHFIYWADMVAGYSNYFVSMLVVPVVSALLVGYACTIIVPITHKSKLLVSFSPPVCTLILVLIVYALLQWGHH